MSFSGGSGIFVCGVLRNMAQARKRWGRDGADMLWGAATVKVILGGLSSQELEDISRLCGEYRETVIGWQRGQGGNSLSATLQDRRTMTPEQIRTLDTLQREALIIHSSSPVVRTRMTRHFEGPHHDVFSASVEEASRIAGIAAPPVPERAELTGPEGAMQREGDQS